MADVVAVQPPARPAPGGAQQHLILLPSIASYNISLNLTSIMSFLPSSSFLTRTSLFKSIRRKWWQDVRDIGGAVPLMAASGTTSGNSIVQETGGSGKGLHEGMLVDIAAWPTESMLEAVVNDLPQTHAAATIGRVRGRHRQGFRHHHQGTRVRGGSSHREYHRPVSTSPCQAPEVHSEDAEDTWVHRVVGFYISTGPVKHDYKADPSPTLTLLAMQSPAYLVRSGASNLRPLPSRFESRVDRPPGTLGRMERHERYLLEDVCRRLLQLRSRRLRQSSRRGRSWVPYR
ncbi:hypothetical protein NMY22_g18141 [Coprinellus aureogranulatus]|nr:hypothetical protein NMY22_g18141 [Coprinellus aureogranulatus]